MKSFARLAGGAALLSLAACETTGDPREGGLFGWSEAKARERQTVRQSAIVGAETELARETGRSSALHSRDTATEWRLTTAGANRRHEEERLSAQQRALVAKCEQLESQSPTAATASRARALRMKVSTVSANAALPPHQRAARLRQLEAEIDAAQARLHR